MPLFDVLQAACVNPVRHYNLPVGLLQVGDPADFIEVGSLTAIDVRRTWIDGVLVAERGQTLLPSVDVPVANKFVAREVTAEELRLPARGTKVRAIEAIDGQLVTNCVLASPTIVHGDAESNLAEDLLKMVVVNRYADAPVAIAFVKNFGLRRGALASSVAHDSHNVIAVGVTNEDLAAAINLVMQAGGGLSAACVAEGAAQVQPLPVAGLMATGTCAEVGERYSQLDQLVKQWGSPLRAPYMTLSFMALLVIPALKLSDLGRSMAESLSSPSASCSIANNPASRRALAPGVEHSIKGRAMRFRWLLALIVGGWLVGHTASAVESIPVTIRVDAAKSIGELKPIWRYFGADEPNYATMPHGRKLLGELGELRRDNVFFRATACSARAMARRRSSGARPTSIVKMLPANQSTIGPSSTKSLTPIAPPACGRTRKLGLCRKALSSKPQPYQHRWRPDARTTKSIPAGHILRRLRQMGRAGVPVGEALRRALRPRGSEHLVLGSVERTKHRLLARNPRRVLQAARLRHCCGAPSASHRPRWRRRHRRQRRRF